MATGPVVATLAAERRPPVACFVATRGSASWLASLAGSSGIGRRPLTVRPPGTVCYVVSMAGIGTPLGRPAGRPASGRRTCVRVTRDRGSGQSPVEREHLGERPAYPIAFYPDRRVRRSQAGAEGLHRPGRTRGLSENTRRKLGPSCHAGIKRLVARRSCLGCHLAAAVVHRSPDQDVSTSAAQSATREYRSRPDWLD
jgi:hypothetical protein